MIDRLIVSGREMQITPQLASFGRMEPRPPCRRKVCFARSLGVFGVIGHTKQFRINNHDTSITSVNIINIPISRDVA